VSVFVVSSGQSISGYQVSANVQFDVLSGGLARYTTVSAGGIALVFGGDAFHTDVLDGGLEYVFSGSVVRGDTIQSGGYELVETSVSASHTTIDGGGRLTVDFDSTVQGTTISSGAELYLGTDTNVVTNTKILLGGRIDLGFLPFSSGTTSATINNSTDQLTVTDGASSYTLQLIGGYEKGHFSVAKFQQGTIVYYKGGSTPSSDQSAGVPLVATSALPDGWSDFSSAAAIAHGGIASAFNIEARAATATSAPGFAASATPAAMPETMVHHGGFIEALPLTS
jgi:autotransporter passenger strand-loop-strand repeat protein